MLTRNPSPPPRVRRARPSIERLSAREIKARREALLAHFERRQRRLDVVATTRTAHGQVLDWVPVESQVPGGVIAAPPPDRPRHELGRTRRAKLAAPVLALRDAKLGPPGTVPIARPDLRRVPEVTLSQFLSKHGHDVITAQLSNGLSIELPEDAPSPHLYAASAQRAICFGGEAWLSANPTWVEWSNEFALMQTSLSNDESGTKQTCETGLQVYKNLYGDWIPHLFVFYTTNGYRENGDNKGGYNTDVRGWVQVDNQIFPKTTFSPLSTPGGAQHMVNIRVQLWRANWWIRVQNRWIGYYPEALYQGGGSTFSSLGDHANRISFYGEITDQPGDARPTRTDMGSGHFANRRWPFAAYMRNMMVQTTRQGGLAEFNGTAWATDAAKYTVEDHFRSGTDWGSYLWLGGPGAG